MAFLQRASFLYNWAPISRLRPFSDHVSQEVFEIYEKTDFSMVSWMMKNAKKIRTWHFDSIAFFDTNGLPAID